MKCCSFTMRKSNSFLPRHSSLPKREAKGANSNRASIHAISHDILRVNVQIGCRLLKVAPISYIPSASLNKLDKERDHIPDQLTTITKQVVPLVSVEVKNNEWHNPFNINAGLEYAVLDTTAEIIIIFRWVYRSLIP